MVVVVVAYHGNVLRWECEDRARKPRPKLSSLLKLGVLTRFGQVFVRSLHLLLPDSS
jgi:hypothetical protein